MHGALSRAALGIVTLSTVSLAQRPAARGIPADFDATVARAMATFKVPGLAVAVVKNDSVIFAKGYGLRALGAPEPVTPHSLFAVGSTSKAFTVAVLQQLEQEGKLRLDDPATQYLPSLQLYDPYVTRELTVRDLVTHRSGLPTANAVWYGTPYSREEILRHLRYRKPSASFRSTWQYQNEMFLAAGQVIAAVDGRSWDDAVKARLFTPLGMRASGTSVRELATMPDVAQPHLERDGTVRRIPYRNIANIPPPGSLTHAQARSGDGRVGRARSASYVPKEGPRYEQLLQDLDALWNGQRDQVGRVTLGDRTFEWVVEAGK